MKTRVCDRRGFMEAALLAGVGAAIPARMATAQEKPRHRVERAGVGAIGMRYQGSVIAEKAELYGDVVAIADVDKNVREQARAAFGSTPRIFEDYRQMIERPDVDVITIGTPDHWHVKMAMDACRAGKDVYLEKPLSLTVDEGKLLCQVVQETGRVLQVGSWQRSDHRFRLATELVRQGRIGKLQRVDVVLGKNQRGGPFVRRQPPNSLNWDLWQGQTPDVPYIEERSHYTFRWWLEYSGGQMTDWGAHHLDIAQWAIGEAPIQVAGQASYPDVVDGYNVPVDFQVTYQYPNDVVMAVSDHGRNGILFTGEKGRIFVNRGSISGAPVEALKVDPLPREEFVLYEADNLSRPERAGKLDAIINHMGNFFDCIETRKAPLSDVVSQHQSVSTCHMANISMALGRPLAWNGETEQFDDADANRLMSRPQRDGFEVV